MRVPEIRWERFGVYSGRAVVGPFLCGIITRSVASGWQVFSPAADTEIGTAASIAEARAIAERWIADEWTKLVVATLAE